MIISITDIINKWVDLPIKKKIAYITGVNIAVLICVIIFLFKYFDNKITKLENEKVTLKNEYTVNLNMVTNRYDALLSAEQKKTQDCNDNFIKYLEKNEKEVRDILFKYEKLKNK